MNQPRQTLLATLLASAFLFGACSGGAGGSDTELVASARSYIDKQDHAAAVIQLKSALQKNVNNAEARQLLGSSLLETGDAKGAAIELRKALELGAEAKVVQPQLAKAMLAQGQTRPVIQEFAAVTLDDPEAQADLKTTVATAYAALGEREKARDAVLAALDASPKNADAQLLRARLLAGDGDIAGALAGVEEVLAGNAKHVGALLFKGDLQRHGLRDRDAAMATYALAIEAQPKAVAGHSALITMLLEKGDVPAARERFEKLKAVQPQNPETLLFEAQFAFIDKNHARTRELTDQLLRMAPDNVRVLQLAGVNEMRLNSLTLAETHLGKVVKAVPRAVVPRQMLARIYTRTGQPGKALEVLKPMLDAPTADANSLTLAGEALLQTGDLAKAEAAFARAAKADPKATTARAALALGQVARGNTAGGFEELEAVAAADPGIRANMALIAARLRSRDIPGALKAIDELEKKQPESPVAHALRGTVLLQQKDTAGATASFEKALKIDPLYYPATAGLASIELAAGRPEGAQKRFDDLLKADPRNALALLGLAELKARTGGNKDEVTAAITLAVKAQPDAAGPRLLLVNHLLAQRDPKAALAAAQEAAGALPDSMEVMSALGTAQLAAGQGQQAISTFGKLASLRPDWPEPELKLAEAYAAANDLASAKRSLDKALQIRPGLVPAQRALALIAVREDKPQEALRIAQSMQKAQPKQATGYLLEADVELLRRRPDAAIAPLRTALQLSPSSETAIKLHAALGAAKRGAEADKLAATWAKEHPRDTAFRYYQGDTALARKDFDAAEARYREVLEIQPENALALNNVAWLMAQQKRPGALALAEKANAVLPNQPALMDTLAYVLALEKQPQRAVELQKKAMAQAPQNNGLRLTLARIYLENGDKVNARTELETLAKLGDKFGAQDEVKKLLATL
ncbi:MAG TPA: XrtA/PEP-CTERM system TPR-repeat protein PrsT [Rubrivivax sp.]|nr:XrtA/PEP-CTERM system TPR-repeat protein PrsT [Rubrivivax sp.]